MKIRGMRTYNKNSQVIPRGQSQFFSLFWLKMAEFLGIIYYREPLVVRRSLTPKSKGNGRFTIQL